MKRSYAVFCAAALAALLINGTMAHAQPILWTYAATSQPDITTASPLSWIELKPGAGNPGGDSAVIIYGLSTHSFQTGTGDTFTNAPFTLSVNLTDVAATGASPGANKVTSATVNFSGLFNAKNVTANSIIPGITTFVPFVPTAALPQDPNTVNTSALEAYAVLGADGKGWRKYTVDITGFVAPGIPGGPDGAIQAVVTITPADGPIASGEGPPSATPEPASIVLAGLGLPLFVFLRRRMKKAQAEASIA